MAIFGSKLMGYKEYIDPEIQSEFEAKYNAAQKEMKRIKEERKIENLEAEKGAPGVGETIVNAVKNNDIVKFARGVGAKAAVAMNGGFGPREEGYSALDNLEEKYLPYVDSFLDLKNEKETEFVKWRIDKELKIQEDLMKAGTLGLAANFMSQMVDFETWVPVYGQVKKVKAAKNVFDLFKAAGKTAMKVAAISAVQEGLVSTVDPSRTDEDIAYAVGTGAVLGGVLGGTMKGLRTKKLIKQKAALDQLRKIPVKARKDILANIEKFEVEEIRRVARERGELEELTPEFKHSDGGVGAAENIDATFDENEVYGKAARKHLNLTKKLHPGSRLISSVYNTSRNFIKRMVPTSYITKGNMSGVVNPDNVENMTEAVKGYGNVARKKIKDFYKSYRKMAKKNPNLPKMNSREFKEHLTKAISAEGQGYSKEFYNMAKEVHEESIGAMYELMKDNLLKGVTKKYSKTYIPRYYKKKMILENIDTFKNKILEPNLRHHIYETIDELDSGMGRTVRGYMDDMFEDMRGRNLIDENFDDMFSDNFINIEDFRRAVDEIKSGKFSDDSFLRATKLIQLDKSSDEILNFLKKIAGDEEKVNIIRKHLNDFDIEKREFLNKSGDFDQGLRETIEEITSKLLNETQEGANPFNRNFITKGPLKQRALNFISDEELNGSIHGISFIETDLDTIIKNYSRQISPQIALQQNFGTTKWGEARVKLENRMMTELRRSGIKETDAKYPKYRKRIQEELDVMENLWKLTDGSYYADFDNWYRDLSFATKTFNYAAMSGLMLISNLADLSFITMKAGLFKTLKHIKNQVALRKSFGLSKNLDLTNMNLKKDFTRMSLNSEAMLKSKLLQKGDMFNPNLDESVFKKSMKGFGQFVHEASLMGSFQRFTEGLSARIAMDDILNSSRKLLKGELNKKERAYLAKYGIGKNQARTIVDNFKKYGTESNGIVSFNFDNWEDMTLRDSVLSKVKNYANSHIIKGGKGDVPIFFQHPIGAVISQFRNFMVSADKLLMGHVLQNMDDYKVWLGMANSVMLGGFVSKLKKMAKGEDSDMTMEEFIADGLEMSGIFSLPMEVNNLWERMGGYGLRSAMGIESKLPSYYAGDIALSQLLGPTVSTINNAASLLHSDKNMSSVRAARRLTPLVNIFYLRKLGDEYEKMLAKTMGVKYKKKRRKK
jgi:hypothetical protein